MKKDQKIFSKFLKIPWSKVLTFKVKNEKLVQGTPIMNFELIPNDKASSRLMVGGNPHEISN